MKYLRAVGTHAGNAAFYGYALRMSGTTQHTPYPEQLIHTITKYRYYKYDFVFSFVTTRRSTGFEVRVERRSGGVSIGASADGILDIAAAMVVPRQAPLTLHRKQAVTVVRSVGCATVAFRSLVLRKPLELCDVVVGWRFWMFNGRASAIATATRTSRSWWFREDFLVDSS